MQASHFRRHLTLILSVLCLLSTASVASAQKLGAVKAATAGKKSPSKKDSDASSSSSSKKKKSDRRDDDQDDHRHHDHCDDDGVIITGFSEFSGQVFLAALSSPFVLPRAIVQDDDLHVIEFPDFPYSNDRSGPLGSLLSDDDPPPWHLALRGQYGDDFSGLSHASGRVLWDASSRFGIDTEFFYRHESLAGGNDELWTGDVNVVYTFAKGELGQFRTGIGVNWLAASGQSDAGFNFTYGGELYPADPFVITGDIDWGRIGDASLFHARTTVGITRDGWGLFTGYDYFSVGDVDLHAWINGVELRF